MKNTKNDTAEEMNDMEPITDKEETTEDVSEKVQQQWKDKILQINNRKLLDYICSLCDARRSIGRADHQVSKKPAKKGDKKIGSYEDDYNGPVKMKPMVAFPVESEDPDQNS